MIQANPPKSMPCVAELGPLAVSPADALASSRQCGILVVDDEAFLRDMLNIGLREEGFAVWLAANGQEAFEVYRCQRAAIDVVVLDMHMPELNGPQTLARLQNLSPQIRCCFLSGDFDSYTEDRLHRLGAAAVLQKPIALPVLAHALRQLASTADLTSSSR